MRVTTSGPVTGLSGGSSQSGLVFYRYTEQQVVARARGESPNPRTPPQQLMRLYSVTATRAWSVLPGETRLAWKRWAEAWHRTSRRTGKDVRPSGQMSFVQAAIMRQVLELPLPVEPPVPLPAPVIASAELLPREGGPDHEFAFRVSLAPGFPRCGTGEWPDYMVLARITPPTATPARAPRPNELRYVAGVSLLSARPLPLDYVEPMVFESDKIAVPPGARFGYELTLIRTADGVASMPLRGEPQAMGL